MKCNCCNNSFSEEKTNYICDYCGFENTGKYSVYLDDPMDKRIVSYRNSLLDSVDSVYIVIIEYKWNPEKKQFDENRKRLFSESFSKDNLNGKMLYLKYHVRDIKMSARSKRKINATVRYSVNGEKKSKNAGIEISNIPNDENIDHIGVMINKNLKIEVYWGVTSVSEPVDIEFDKKNEENWEFL